MRERADGGGALERAAGREVRARAGVGPTRCKHRRHLVLERSRVAQQRQHDTADTRRACGVAKGRQRGRGVAAGVHIHGAGKACGSGGDWGGGRARDEGAQQVRAQLLGRNRRHLSLEHVAQVRKWQARQHDYSAAQRLQRCRN